MRFPEVPIGAAFDVRNGATPASNEPGYWDGDIPWVGPADLGKLRSRFIEKGERSITPEGYASCGTRMVPAGTIILSTRAPIGHIAIASQPMCFNQGCRGLVPRPMVRTDFAYWCLLARRQHLVAAGQGTTFIELGRDKLRAEHIPLPDPDTQKAIADFLDRETGRVDRLIEKKQRLVELLREKLRATTSNYFEVLEKNNTTQWRLRHLLREPLKYGANESSDSDDADGVRFIRITDLGSDGTLRDDNVKVLPLDKAQPYMLCDGDILLARSGATVGKSFIYRDAFGPCCFAGYLIRARLRLSVILPDFLKRFTETARYWDFIAQSNIQATIQNVSAERYANLLIPLPSIAHQVEILDGIEKLEAPLRCALAQVNKSVERLREFRATLITAAVTGQIDVATWGKRGQADCRLDALQREMTS